MRAQSQALVARSAASLEIGSRPRSLIDGISRRSLFELFGRIESGALSVVENGQRHVFGRPSDLSATITVHDAAAYRALLWRGSVGAGEGYMAGLWTCDDLAALARIFARNLDALAAIEGGAARLMRFTSQLVAKATRRNTRAGSRRNIAHHYDLSNEFFGIFLDESMMYSSGIFEWEAATLEDAQLAKLDRVCQKLDLRPQDHLLEIGSGWGALAIHAARSYGCRVTTTTVSAEQHRLTTERVRALGLQDRIEVLLSDYRDLTGQYDKLVSIEMVEAVGHEYLEDYFRACSERLAPDGQMLIQAITIADQHHDQHRASVDFIQEYIFPGSCIPSVTSMMNATTRGTDLRLFHFEDITPHYAQTLRIWRERFLENADAVRRLGFDEPFLRMWEYYLAYCEGGFAERYLGCVQMLFTKPDSRRTSLLPKLR